MKKVVIKYNDTCNYLVCVRWEDPFCCVAQKHIGNMSYRNAKSYLKRFNKYNNGLWSDREQTGIYCMIVSRNYCSNHAEYEIDYNTHMLQYKI